MSDMVYIKYGKIVYIKTEKIISKDSRTERQTKKNTISEISKSIEHYGIIEPIIVRSLGRGYYEIISGERRCRAARAAGLASIPAVVIHTNARNAAMLSAINGYSHCFNFIEEAETYQNLMAEYGFSHEEIAENTGKSVNYVYDKMKLLRLSHCMRDEIIFYGIPESTALCISDIANEELRREILNKVAKFGLNLERTQRLIEKTKMNNNEKNTLSRKIEGHIGDIRIFTNSVKSSVKMMNEAGIDTNYNVADNDEGYTVTINVKWKKQPVKNVKCCN